MQEQKIESVGIREFRTNLHKYTSTGINAIAVTSHGERIGFYIPVKPSPTERDFEALRQATAKFNALLQESGLTTEALMVDFKNELKETQPVKDESAPTHS